MRVRKHCKRCGKPSRTLWCSTACRVRRQHSQPEGNPALAARLKPLSRPELAAYCTTVLTSRTASNDG